MSSAVRKEYIGNMMVFWDLDREGERGRRMRVLSKIGGCVD